MLFTFRPNFRGLTSSHSKMKPGSKRAPKNSLGHSLPTSSGSGLYDMAGNVWQWVEDCYDSPEETSSDAGPQTAVTCSYHIVRGGAFDYYVGFLRPASRRGYQAITRGSNLGFRLARTFTS
jgi:formylglycine-generating enzyme required for sulfatase activity